MALTLTAAGVVFASLAFFGEKPQPERPAATPPTGELSPTRPESRPPVKGRITETFPLEGANSVAYGAGSVWVGVLGYGSGDRLVRFNPDTGEQLAEIPVDGVTSWEVGGGGIAFAGGDVWVVGRGKGGAVVLRGTVIWIDSVAGWRRLISRNDVLQLSRKHRYGSSAC